MGKSGLISFRTSGWHKNSLLVISDRIDSGSILFDSPFFTVDLNLSNFFGLFMKEIWLANGINHGTHKLFN